MSLQVVQMGVDEANDFVHSFHRHNKKTQGGKWAIGASDGTRLITYTLPEEGGASLRAVGMKIVGETRPRSAETIANQQRKREYQPIYGQTKFRWELSTRPAEIKTQGQ